MDRVETTIEGIARTVPDGLSKEDREKINRLLQSAYESPGGSGSVDYTEMAENGISPELAALILGSELCFTEEGKIVFPSLVTREAPQYLLSAEPETRTLQESDFCYNWPTDYARFTATLHREWELIDGSDKNVRITVPPGNYILVRVPHPAGLSAHWLVIEKVKSGPYVGKEYGTTIGKAEGAWRQWGRHNRCDDPDHPNFGKRIDWEEFTIDIKPIEGATRKLAKEDYHVSGRTGRPYWLNLASPTTFMDMETNQRVTVPPGVHKMELEDSFFGAEPWFVIAGTRVGLPKEEMQRPGRFWFGKHMPRVYKKKIESVARGCKRINRQIARRW